MWENREGGKTCWKGMLLITLEDLSCFPFLSFCFDYKLQLLVLIFADILGGWMVNYPNAKDGQSHLTQNVAWYCYVQSLHQSPRFPIYLPPPPGMFCARSLAFTCSGEPCRRGGRGGAAGEQRGCRASGRRTRARARPVQAAGAEPPPPPQPSGWPTGAPSGTASPHLAPWWRWRSTRLSCAPSGGG